LVVIVVFDVLIEIPLVHEDTIVGGVLAVVMVTPAYVTWLVVSRSPLQAAIVLGPLSAVLVVLYLRSQHRPGVLPPPLPEWAIAGGRCARSWSRSPSWLIGSGRHRLIEGSAGGRPG
jgi:hypothetical protein